MCVVSGFAFFCATLVFCISVVDAATRFLQSKMLPASASPPYLLPQPPVCPNEKPTCKNNLSPPLTKNPSPQHHDT